MSGKQATLGKFFGRADGVKSSKPQQSTLAFKKKDEKKEQKVKEEEHEEAELPKQNGNGKHDADQEDVEMGDEDATVKTEEAGTDTTSEEEGKGTNGKVSVENAASKKRMILEADDEPPSKRQKPTTAPKKPAAASKQNASPKSSDKKSKVKQEKPPTPQKKAPANKRKKAVIEDEEDDLDNDANEDLPKKASTKRAVESPASDNESLAEQDEAEDSEEDEKPEVAAKAREKVQSTLKASSKDPYPDWKAGDPVPYAALCTTFSKIEMTTKRLEILAHCSLFLRQVLRLTPDDLLPTILLMINKLAADYAGIELGIGESLIMKAIGETTGRSLQVIKSDQNEIGDLGLVAAKSRSNQRTMFKPKPLTVRGVHEGLMQIAIIEGQGAQARKIGGIKKLLAAADVETAGKGTKGVDITKNKGGPSEAKFIVRTLEGKLRLGLADKTVLVALAQAVVVHEVLQQGNKVPSTEQLAKGETTLKSVYSELPSYEVIIPAILKHGLSHLKENCKLQAGVPLKPMLAKPTKSITEVLDRFEGKHFTCEYKYDGERAQIHFVSHDSAEQYATAAPKEGKTEKGISNIFSRNSEDLSKKYPDILAKLPTWVKDGTKSFVLDCETVAWDMVEKKVLPFQQLMTRKRKDVKVEDVKVKVCVFAFDLLFLNGEALVNKSFRERRELLHESFKPAEGEFAFATFGNTDQLEEIQTLLDESVKASCEGLMVKMLDGPESSYEPSRRSQNWLKVKKDYLSGVGDSLDLVVLGAYYGKGKRTSWYGAFLLACWNPKTQNYETVCNIGTGFSEAILETLHEELGNHVIDKPKPYYSHSAGNKDQPDVWFEDKFVWEVKTADLTLSPRYKAAANEILSSGGKGVSLRFPRFIKQRDDKKPEEATSSGQIAEMYQKQESVAKNKGPSVDDDFEY
ncbi:ATP-dependent DNA ligase [Rhizodiscina lignyota]|uniref:DNA ligase n=1 Tax=Rhizodiscina lignyota TaxID=1504668 RepID=A0A9P4IAM8_9PEZI|nr:ATP-dependent DNA ligase [Rhizodiscina lignyota]